MAHDASQHPPQIMPVWDYLRHRRERKEAEAALKAITPRLVEYAEGADERIARNRATLQRRTERYKREDEEKARRKGRRGDQGQTNRENAALQTGEPKEAK
ncbi:MAG: hypothetical protein Q9216_000051 [Gyalolechia sp. 2 TL-2023]